MRVFPKPAPKSPVELISQDAVIACLEARELVNQAIKDHGAASPVALATGRAYKASRVTATKALVSLAINNARNSGQMLCWMSSSFLARSLPYARSKATPDRGRSR